MAASYVWRPPPSASRTSFTRTAGESEGAQRPHAMPQGVVSADPPIYIFPSPSSAPPTPSPASPRSSLYSAPTDFEFNESACPFDSRSRTSSNALSTTASASECGVAVTRSRVSPLADDEMEIGVGLWGVSKDPGQMAGTSDSDSSWILEDEVERVSAGDIDVSSANSPRGPRRMHSLSTPASHDATYAQSHRVTRPHGCTRAHSRIRTISSLSSTRASPTNRRPSPNPRIHIPLLSFFSSLLSVDLDDPALRLLTHADPGEAQSVLFPGHTTSQLLDQVDACYLDRQTESESDKESASSVLGAETHGLPKLLLASISDHSTVALRSLRSGLSVYMPHSANVGLYIPRPSEISRMWRVVGKVCMRSSQAWRGVLSGFRSDA